MTPKRNLLLLPLLILLTAGIPAAAQNTSHDDDKAGLIRDMLGDLGQFAVTYWVPKLNEYRVRIDRSLRSSDVNELNALRVRWSMLVEEELARSESRNRIRTERSYDTAVYATTEPTTVDIAMEEPAPIEGEGAGPGFTSGDEIGVASVEMRVEAADEDPAAAPSYQTAPEPATEGPRIDARVDSEGALIEQPTVVREKEPIMVLVESAQVIASQNRPQMDAIREQIIRDFSSFLDQAIARVEKFYEANRSRLDPDDVDGWNEVRESLKSQDARDKIIAEFTTLYTSGGESFVMLYNGVDIFRILGVGILGMEMPAEASLSDMNIAATSTLSQNIPNPAGTTTRISYSLQEPSTGTSLEIFDASGRTMLRLDEGARAAGEHTAVVDISALPAGSYLYRLTIQSAQGEQVSSKVMQVAR
jgi:hypothetical protein